jgi:hypothetical protein
MPLIFTMSGIFFMPLSANLLQSCKPQRIFTPVSHYCSTLIIVVMNVLYFRVAIIAFLISSASLSAQQGSSTTASMVSISVSSPIAERRALSSTMPTPVFITATRSNTSGAALVLLDIQYRSRSGQPFSNAELQEDWGTTGLSLENMGTFTNFILLDQGQTQNSIALYPGRVNFRQNPDRILSARILPPRAFTGQQYSINPSTTHNTVTITLRDNSTAPTQPYIINGIQNMAMTSGSVNLIEIETPSLRNDGLPSRVFANERGIPLFYSTTSFQPNICRAEILTGDMRPSGLSALRLTGVMPGRATVILVAVDSSNHAATASFEVLVQQDPRTVSVRSLDDQELECSPNPVSDVMSLRGVRVGAECRLYSTDGRELRRWKAVSSEERVSLEDLPMGAYLLAIEQSGRRIVRSILHQ